MSLRLSIMFKEMREAIFDKQVVLISTDYRVLIIYSDGKTQEKEISLKVSNESELTWSQERGFTYTFTLDPKGKCFLTKSSVKGGGSGLIPVVLQYQNKVFTWTEIKTGCQYIFTPITEIELPFDDILFEL